MPDNQDTYTIKEIADMLGVTRQAISKQLSKQLYKQHVTTLTDNQQKRLQVDKTGYELLRKHYRTSNHGKKPVDNAASNVDVNRLQEIVKILREELQEKNKQLEKAQQLTDQAQQLQLAAETKLKQLEAPSEAHNAPVSSSNSSKGNSSDNEPKQAKKHHWWQFFQK